MKNKIIPKNKEELENIIYKEIKQYGIGCDLNHIDVSLITDMSYLFSHSVKNINWFNGDISQWNTVNVKNFNWMFHKGKLAELKKESKFYSN